MPDIAMTPAARVVAIHLAKRAPADRPEFLKELMGHAAAALVVAEGAQGAAESTYRLADALVSRVKS